VSGKLGGTCDVRQIIFLPLGIFNSYVSLIQIKIFFGTIRRISSPKNLAVTSWDFSCFLSPGLYGNHDVWQRFSQAYGRNSMVQRQKSRFIPLG